MARLLALGFDVTGIEPSAEMRRLAAEHVPMALVSDGSVLELAAGEATYDFVYAIEVFRYLDTADNAAGHREIVRVLKPGGIYFGTYVNKWALDYPPVRLVERNGRALARRPAALPCRIRNAGIDRGETT